MRNYLKFRAIEWFADSQVGYNPPQHLTPHNFGKTDDALMVNVTATEERIVASADPLIVWSFTFPKAPIDYFFKLDKNNLDILLNDNADFFYNNFVPPDSSTTVLYQELVSVNVSPRATFPTDLGTDGQRLRQNKTASQGAALNYIAKLYFLTSNRAFKDLFDSLKANKISEQQALAAANILVQSA